jgi:hypothetical protein
MDDEQRYLGEEGAFEERLNFGAGVGKTIARAPEIGPG